MRSLLRNYYYAFAVIRTTATTQVWHSIACYYVLMISVPGSRWLRSPVTDCLSQVSRHPKKANVHQTKTSREKQNWMWLWLVNTAILHGTKQPAQLTAHQWLSTARLTVLLCGKWLREKSEVSYTLVPGLGRPAMAAQGTRTPTPLQLSWSYTRRMSTTHGGWCACPCTAVHVTSKPVFNKTPRQGQPRSYVQRWPTHRFVPSSDCVIT